MKTETVLVTGASSGIGLELARCFAAEGSRMILVARRGGALRDLAEELKGTHRIQTQVLTVDLSQPESPANLFRHLSTGGIKVDVLINNAGFGAQGAFAQLPLDRQLEMVQVNVMALTHLTRLFLPGMLERKRGGVINVASTAAFQAGPGMAVYYATKAYVLSLSEALAEEVRGTGVAVTALCPGPTETGFAEAADAKNSRLFKMSRRMSAASVAQMGQRAFRRGDPVAITGSRNRFLAFSTRLTPRWLVRRVVKYLNAESAVK